MESILSKALLQASAVKRSQEDKEIVITDENLKKKINIGDIMYIQRQQSKSIIYTKQRTYNVYETLTSLYERLGEGFLRINQGEVTSVKEIREIRGNVVVLKNGEEMSIGRTYRKEVMAKYFGKETNS